MCPICDGVNDSLTILILIGVHYKYLKCRYNVFFAIYSFMETLLGLSGLPDN